MSMNKSQRYCFGNRRGRGQIRDALTHAICSAERHESQAVPGRKRPDVVGYRSETCVYVQRMGDLPAVARRGRRCAKANAARPLCFGNSMIVRKSRKKTAIYLKIARAALHGAITYSMPGRLTAI